MQTNLFCLEDSVAVVTGAGSGIGKAIALHLAQAGAAVLVHTGTRQAHAEQTSAEIRKLGRETSYQVADFHDTQAQDQFCEQAWAWRGKVDLFVHAAGLDVLTGQAAEWDFETKLQHLLEVDLVATMRICRNLGRRMKAHGGGSIVTLGWDQADQGMEGDSGEMFTAVKGAVMAFTRSLAKSLAPEVRVNGIAPGWIKTKWGESTSKYWEARATGESQLARWGTAEDVAAAAVFLASPAAKFIHGQILPVNGGFNHSQLARGPVSGSESSASETSAS